MSASIPFCWPANSNFANVSPGLPVITGTSQVNFRVMLAPNVFNPFCGLPGLQFCDQDAWLAREKPDPVQLICSENGRFRRFPRPSPIERCPAMRKLSSWCPPDSIKPLFAKKNLWAQLLLGWARGSAYIQSHRPWSDLHPALRNLCGRRRCPIWLKTGRGVCILARPSTIRQDLRPWRRIGLPRSISRVPLPRAGFNPFGGLDNPWSVAGMAL